jgi:hypothetical protein
MDWRQFNNVALKRMQRMIRDQARELAEADAWLSKYGRPPDDPLRGEVRSALRHLEHLAACVGASAVAFEPYRPGVDPWRTRGLSAVLKADFAARGITERPAD